MVNPRETGLSPETGPSKTPADLVRDFNQKISNLIKKAEAGEVVTNDELAELNSEYNQLDADLSDKSFDDDEIGKLYDNFQKRIPGRIERLVAQVKTNSGPSQRFVEPPPQTETTPIVREPVAHPENNREVADVEWPPDYVKELRETIDRRKVQLKETFYPGDEPVLDQEFDFSKPETEKMLQALESVLNELRTVNPDTGKSELDLIKARKKTVEKTLQFLANSSRVSDVLKHEELESLLHDTEDFLEGYQTLEIVLYQEMAPLIHPEIRAFIETSLAPDVVGLTDPKEIFDRNREFTFNKHSPEIGEHIAKIESIVKQLEKAGKEGHAKAISKKYLTPAKEQIDNWKTVTYNSWHDNLAQLYPDIFNFSDANSFTHKISRYENDAKLYAMDLEDLFDAKDEISAELQKAQAKVTSEITAGNIPSKEQDPRYESSLQSQLQRAQVVIDKITSITKEQTDPSMATRTAVKFFEGGFSPIAPREWREGRWRVEHPAKLAKAIWEYIEAVLLKGEARADLTFMKVDVLGTHLDLPDSPTIVSLLRAFIALSKEFKGKTINGKDKGDLFFEIGDQMITDIVQIQRIYSFGYEVREREQDPHGLISYFTTSGNQMTYVDHERNYQMGRKYMDHEGGITLSERLLWAQQAYFAMHDPIYHPYAIVGEPGYETAGPNEHKEIIFGVDEKNPLTFFPEATANETDRLLKRFLIRIIAGSDEPPFWTKIEREDNETLHQFYLRKMGLIREYLNDEYTKLKAQFDRNSETGQANRKDEFLDDDQKLKLGKGYIAEQLSHSLGEYSLEPCKAEGQSLLRKAHSVRNGNGTFEMPVLNPHKGPTAIFYVSRFWSIGDYRAKLTDPEGGREGATGPQETLRDFNTIMDTQYDYYFYIPPKTWKNEDYRKRMESELAKAKSEDEKRAIRAKYREKEDQGVTLKEAIALSNNLADTGQIQFANALSSPYRPGSESLLGWYEEIRLSENHWNRISKPDGLGISWAQLRRFEPGSQGVMVTFDPSTVTSKLFPFAREVTYMMQRDKGVKMYEWKDINYWQRHHELELNYVAQLQSGVSEPKKPDNLNGTPVSDKEWALVKELRIAPTYRHKLDDMVDPGDQTRTKIVRYAHTWHEVVQAPKSKENRDEFEDAVLSNPYNSAWDIYKKLFVGKIIIGSISVGDVDNIGYKEAEAIKQILSRESWERTMNSVSEKILKTMSGRQRHPQYQGLGLMTEAEVTAMLRRASVNMRWGAVITDLLETIAKVK